MSRIVLRSAIAIPFAAWLIHCGAKQMEETTATVIAPDAELTLVADGFQFTEGVTSDSAGNIYFSDIPADRIYHWTLDGSLSVFLDGSGNSNGLQVADDGRIIACQHSGDRAVVTISMDKNIEILADRYDGREFNSPNDLWIDPHGGIYFTDPRYGRRGEAIEQDGEHVYYLTPDRSNVIRVVDDMVRPNGITGTPDGSVLYVSDREGEQTFSYGINEDGSLTGKRLFNNEGSDGMTIDSEGNVYLTVDGVKIYNSGGQVIDSIATPQMPTNVCFGGTDNRTLFITARDAVHSIELAVHGVGSN